MAAAAEAGNSQALAMKEFDQTMKEYAVEQETFDNPTNTARLGRRFNWLRPWDYFYPPKDDAAELEEKKNREYNADEHLLSVSELAERFNCQIDEQDPEHSHGLETDFAEQRLISEGKNRLSPPKQKPEILKFLEEFLNLFMVLLIVAGLLSFIAYAIDTTQTINLYLGVVLIVVVFITCSISYLQQRQTADVLKKFKNMLPSKCHVIRGGQEMQIAAENLVRGDIVKFGLGDKIPADLRLLAVNGAKVEASSITGESEPITCATEKTHERPTESRNLVFNGCLCLQGSGVGIVVRTGDKTLIGSIAGLASQTSTGRSTLQVEVSFFVRFISLAGLVMAIVFYIIGVARGQNALYTFVNGFIVVFVANVPEGLPATVTTVLTIAAKRLAGKDIYIKRLDIIETLGSTTVIASDKTGTLTQNLMSVASFWCNRDFLRFEGPLTPNYKKELRDAPYFKPILLNASLCNRARFDETEAFNEISVGLDRDPLEHPNRQDNRRIIGDASDTALFRFCHSISPVDDTRARYRTIFEIPFNSANKWALAIVEDTVLRRKTDNPAAKSHMIMIKGAPEIVQAKCTTYLSNGEIYPIDDHFTGAVKTAFERCARQGERVLAFAQKELSGDEALDNYVEEPLNFTIDKFTFVGLVSLIDPPRPNVEKAVTTIKNAGIRVVMVTGDHPVTAEAIARKVGIIRNSRTMEDVALQRGVPVSEVKLSDHDVQAVAYNGYELTKIDETVWTTILSKQEIVFARTTPTQKLEIVERLQARGEVVAVTGDGVNDSPALKRADCGVAMGQMGSDVAREAADIILLKDDFASIVDAIKMGRLVFDNLKKSIAYTLAHLWPEIVPVLLYLAVSFPVGLSSTLILSIDLGTELGPAISLAYEEPENDILERPPRNVKTDRLVSFRLLFYSYLQAGIIHTAVCLFAFLWAFQSFGIPLSALPFNAQTYFVYGAPTIYFDSNSNLQIYNSTMYGAYPTSSVAAGSPSPSAFPYRLYTDDDQVYILTFAQTSYYITVVFGQFWHVWLCKARRASIFTHGIFSNTTMFFGVIIEMAILVIIVYVPGVQGVFESTDVFGVFWLFHLLTGGILFIYTEVIKFYARKHPGGFVDTHIAW